MSHYMVKLLGPGTWDAFARLVERHNGVWNGCWCTWFHPSCAEKGQTAEGNRALKERLVKEGRAHGAPVFDGDVAVAWCEYGTPEELPNIYHRKEYEADLDSLPDSDSPASSWIRSTGAREWQASRSMVLYT